MLSAPHPPAPPPELDYETKRLLLVDDHAAVRAGLLGLLRDEPDFDVVAAVATAEEAKEVAEREAIDVAVVDYQLRARNGLWLSRKLKRLANPPAVLIYSAYTDGVLAAAAVVAQADGIVSKGGLGAELCSSIRSVAGGRRRLPPVAPWLGDALRSCLDEEQQAIFGMLLAGFEPAEISEMLSLSASEVESRLWAMLRALEGPRSRLVRDEPGSPRRG
jgi:DNA-binding NarL/FixJ family response regulator